MIDPALVNGDLGFLLEEFADYLRSARKAKGTVQRYTAVSGYMILHLVAAGGPFNAADVKRADVNSYLRDVQRHQAASTHVNAYKAVRAFFAFLVDIGEIEAAANPMIGIRCPKQPPLPDVPILPANTPELMIAACRQQNGFWSLRDEAVIRLFWDTPGRLSEIGLAKVADVDIAARSIQVMGKGSNPRPMRFSKETARILNRYIVRREAQWRERWGDDLWVTERGGKYPEKSLYLVICKAAKKAGLGHVHPHQFRHTFADRWLAADGGEIDLINLAGWSSTKMLMRYGRANAQNRALGAYDRVLG